ncbi:MAG: archaeal proteasome endopeptidase complex subunit alpha [Candidatus Aenigmarchaeota archaeon]|nr:archaeal proteasome endopeptidase complex subunit alpha [Candidatus Aenigmarchaeota archaeon]
MEYAKEAVKRGSTALGIVFKDGVVLATVRSAGKLVVSDAMEKIFQIDDHAAAVASGLLADARVLIQQTRVKAQMHKITYDEPIDMWNLAKSLGNRMQLLTQYGGLRPYGVSLILGGVDNTGVHLIESDPSGTLFEWKAFAIGRGAPLAMKILHQRWKENLGEKEAVELALEIIDKAEKDGKEKKEIVSDLAVIRKDGRFKKYNESDAKALK